MITRISWNKNEILPVKNLQKLQLKRLKYQLKYIYQKSPFYGKKLKTLSLKPDNISSLEDLKKLPFTNREDLVNHYHELICVDTKDIVEIHATSGTTEKPVVIPYTWKDIEIWKEVMARSLFGNGIRNGDKVYNALSYEFFSGARGHELGAQVIGAMVIPAGMRNAQRNIILMRELKANVITSTPSYMMHLAKVAKENSLDPQVDFSLKLASLGAESWSESLRKRIEKTWGIVARETYGLTEIIGPGVSFECMERSGLHINADHFLPEIIDPKTGDQLESGEKGELVLTTLTKEALPLLRYRTGDLTSLIGGKCECGRTLPQHTKVVGRIDEGIKVKGILIFPTQVEHVLLSMPNISENYELIPYKREFITCLKLRVESPDYTNKFLKEKIQSKLRAILGVSIDVELLKPNTLPKIEGKVKRLKR